MDEFILSQYFQLISFSWVAYSRLIILGITTTAALVINSLPFFLIEVLEENLYNNYDFQSNWLKFYLFVSKVFMVLYWLHGVLLFVFVIMGSEVRKIIKEKISNSRGRGYYTRIN